MKKRVMRFIIVSFIGLLPLNLIGQVTIGSENPPEKAALLDIKEKSPNSPGDETATSGGILFPRVNLVKKGELLPFFNATDIGTDDYENIQKPAHKGLFIYNLNDDIANTDSEGFEEGAYFWDGEGWLKMQENKGPAQFGVDNCDTSVSVYGTYGNNVSLDASNYIKVTVTVKKVGLYSIIAKPNPDNGYFFSTSGEFLTTGTFDIIVPGVGKPVSYTASGAGDKVEIFLNNSENASCSTYITIDDTSVKPNYSMACASVKVNGVYKKGIELNSTNTITLRLNVEAGAAGAKYKIKTSTIEGVYFEGEGILGNPGSQTITLYGHGTPSNTRAKSFTLKTNSSSTPDETCTAIVTVVIARKKIATAGNQTYGLTANSANGNNCQALIENKMNFGDDENSIVKYEGLTGLEVNDSSTLTDALFSKWTGEDGVTPPMDIIIITYNVNLNANQIQMATNYVDKGGVLIVLDQHDSQLNANLVGSIFGESLSPTVANGDCNYVIKLNTIDDEILNGPFGDIRGLQWGEDFNNTTCLQDIPFGAIVYSATVNAFTNVQANSNKQVTMLRHPSKNFFWCGDSGLIRGGDASDRREHPLNVGTRIINSVSYDKYPIAKMHGYISASNTSTMPVYNSVLFANVIAWAIRNAEENGINGGQTIN